MKIMPAPLPQETLDRILELYDQGLKNADVAKRAGVSSSMVTKTVKEAGRTVATRKRRGPSANKVSDSELRLIAEAYRDAPDDVGVEDISKQFKRSAQLVYKALRVNGVKLKPNRVKNHVPRKGRDDMNEENKKHEAWLRENVVVHDYAPLSASSLAGL